MARSRVSFASSVALSTALAFGAHAQESNHQSPVLELSPPLRTALIEEMQQVDANMQRIVTSLARGDWSSLVECSKNIKGSFILEQNLSAEQRAELHAALPEEFLALDARFHETAGRLAVAAGRSDAELAAFYTYKLAESCVYCHEQYAPHRFPGFEAEKPKDH